MIDERGFKLVEREKGKALLAKTFAGECETLKEAIRSFIVILLKEIRKPCLELCKFIDVLIDDFERGMKQMIDLRPRTSDNPGIDTFINEYPRIHRRTFFQKTKEVFQKIGRIKK